MTELIQTALLVGMICVVEWLMRRKVRRVTHPPLPKHATRPDQVVHEVDKQGKAYGV